MHLVKNFDYIRVDSLIVLNSNFTEILVNPNSHTIKLSTYMFETLSLVEFMGVEKKHPPEKDSLEPSIGLFQKTSGTEKCVNKIKYCNRLSSDNPRHNSPTV